MSDDFQKIDKNSGVNAQVNDGIQQQLNGDNNYVFNFILEKNPFESQEPKETIKEEKKETSKALENISRVFNSLCGYIKNISLAYDSYRRDMYNFLFILFIITSIIFATISLYLIAIIDANDRLFDFFFSSLIVFFLLIGYHYFYKFCLPYLQKKSLYEKITITIVSDILFFVLVTNFKDVVTVLAQYLTI